MRKNQSKMKQNTQNQQTKICNVLTMAILPVCIQKGFLLLLNWLAILTITAHENGI
jgi:hypothetical protein